MQVFPCVTAMPQNIDVCKSQNSSIDFAFFLLALKTRSFFKGSVLYFLYINCYNYKN